MTVPSSKTVARSYLARSSIIETRFIDFGDDGDDGAEEHSLWRRHPQPQQPGQARGLSVNHQSVEFGVWLGMAVMALVWAYVQIWQARRALNRVQQDRGVQQGKSVSSAVAELASSVIAQ